MRLTGLLIAAATLSFTPALGGPLRVLSYNIHHSEGLDEVFDLERIANVITSANPDVVALQELDQGNGRSGFNVFQLNRLAQLTGFRGYFGKTIDYSGGQYGNGVLIGPDLTINSITNRPLPNPAGGESRAVMEVRLSTATVGLDFTFFATHFDHTSNDANRLAQAEYVNALVANSSGPAILAGDLNSRPASAPFQQILEQWVDATDAVNSGVNRASQIDYVLYRSSDQWNVVEKSHFIVNPTTQVASDHYPLLTELHLIPTNGDFNGDGAVDALDYVVWRDGLGTVYMPSHFELWRTHFGEGTGSGSASANSPVPEPAALWMLLVLLAVGYRLSIRMRSSG